MSLGLRATALAALALAGCVPGVSPTPPPTGSPAGSTTAPPAAASATGTGAPTSGPAEWRRIPDIPTPRSEVAAAVFRGAVYVIGGFGGTSVVERFSPGDPGVWSRVADLPLGVDHPMAAAIETGPAAGVYVIGGNAGGRATARAFRLELDAAGQPPVAGSWREIASMPAPRSQGAAVAIGARIYVVGGARDAMLHRSVYEYDAEADRWATRAEIPTPRDHLAAAELDGRVCAVGGRTLSMARNLASLECYDPAADRWESLPDAPTARGGVGAAVVGGRLFLIGGEQPSGTFSEVEIYDSAAGRWEPGPDLPTARHGIGVVSLGGTVYVMTGGPTPGGSQTAVCEALEAGSS